ncbi:hypothetical protein BBI01_19460 [Chryseobacterium artocarpi]|uniref:Uncharacterized protein n=2 Tax=Chryseobacterium artocarpi TaxID=1414727 RepID=A0A1B8ZAH0_9FLAO|nr:hypothetical protein BBI01_19460 [Chryseobacterium artocarpi]
MILQFCNAQQTEYSRTYNRFSPELQDVANNKTKFNNQKFKDFYKSLGDRGLEIKMFSYDAKEFNSKDNYILKLYFMDNKSRSYANDNHYQFPMIKITFKEKMPQEVEPLTKQYHGEWNNVVAKFFSNMEIEKIEFYGINGFNSTDRRVR